MAAYVDGFLVPVPKRKLDDYRKLARKMGKVWIDHGALSYVECAGDDVPVGKVTSFTRAVKLKRGETVIFAWITYKSRAHRDKVNDLVMNDPRARAVMNDKTFPFDMARMIFGGFKAIVEY